MAEMNTTTTTADRAVDAIQRHINTLAAHGMPATLIVTSEDGTPIRLVADDAVDFGIVNSRDDQRIAGALECLEQLRKIEAEADNLPEAANEARVYFELQKKAGADLAAAFGPMTPRQEGYIRALGELVHSVFVEGLPYLERWCPVAAQTEAELQAVLEEIEAA